MTDFKNPVGDRPKDPYEDIRVSRVEEEKKEKEPFKRLPPERQAGVSSLIARFTQILRKMISIFQPMQEEHHDVFLDEFIHTDLKKLKGALDILKSEDHSQDTEFLHILSDIWHKVLKDTEQFQKKSPLFPIVQEFIYTVQNYPEEKEHSFGYYLTEFAGLSWLPFPYMEMLKNLHQEHSKNPQNSTLQRWTTMIDKITIAAHSQPET